MKAPTLFRLGLAAAGAVLLAGTQTKQEQAQKGSEIDWEFMEKAKAGKVPASVLIPKLRAMLAPPALADDALFFDDLFAAACAQADKAEWAECAKIAVELPEDSFRFSGCFSALSEALLRSEAMRLTSENQQPPKFPKINLRPPEQLAGAPEEILDAWRLYQSVAAPYRELIRAERTEQRPPGGDSAFAESALRRLLSAPEPGLWRQLLKSDWRGPCGTGSEMLYHPRNRGILLSLLADGKLAEAAGAVLELVPGMMEQGHPLSPTIAKLVTAFGLDWEALYLGSLLPDPDSHFGIITPPNRVYLYDRSEHSPWSTLAAMGSDRGIRLCLALVRHVDPERRGTIQFLNTALGPEPEDGSVTIHFGTPELKRARSVSPEVRRELLDVLATFLVPMHPAAELDEVLRDLPTRLVRDLRAPLGVLAANPSRRIASKARELLGEAGLAARLAPLPPASPPLERRLLANGRPLSQTAVTLYAKPRQQGLDEELTSGDDGLLRISLENLPEVRALKEITLRSRPKEKSSVPGLDIPRLSDQRDEGQPVPRDAIESTPWFTITTRAFAGETGVRDLPVNLAALEVRVAAAGEESSGGRAVVRLWRFEHAEDEFPEFASPTLEMQVGGTARFTQLQLGIYRVAVEADGYAYFEGKKVTLGASGVVMPVTLQRGVAVTGALIFPNGKRQTLEWVGELYQDGVLLRRYAYGARSTKDVPWHGLSAGKYRAVVEASKDAAPADRYGRLEFEFEIKADNPALIDLGEHHVPAAE